MLGTTKIVLDRRDMSLTPHLVMDGFWESWITCWAKRNAAAQDRVLNIGANCGYYAMLFAGQCQRVVAVEPQQNLAANIAISAALNGWTSKVKVEQVVAGVHRRQVDLQMHEHFAGSAFVGVSADEASGWSSSMKVEEVPASELMEDATCVFVDSEGYEPYIWQGLRPLLKKKQLRWAALEWAPSRYEDPARFLDELQAYGRLSVVREQGQEAGVSRETLLAGTEWDTLIVRVHE